MSTVLVTIVGPEARTDAVAPADTPVAELIATFAQLTGTEDAPPGLELGLPGAPALLDGGTLGEQGVVDGGVLQLRPRGGPAVDAGVALSSRSAATSDGDGPVQRTRDALPEWVGLPRRLRAACAASSGTGGPRACAARVRDAWRSTSYARRLENAIQCRRLTRPVTIAVVSVAPGAGRTTIALLLASLFERLRVDRTVLLQTAAQPRSRARVGVNELLGMLAHGLSATQLAGLLSPANDGLALLRTEPGAGAADYERLMRRLHDAAGLLVIDCGPGLDDPAAQAAMTAADQLVVVVGSGPDSAGHVAAASARLRNGAPPAVLVVNRIPRRGQDVAPVERDMPHARGLIAVHDDPRRAARLAAGEPVWHPRAGGPGLAPRELAALLVSAWTPLGFADRR